MIRLPRSLGLLLPIFLLASCETAPPGIQAAKAAMAQNYATEMPGDYFIGRRYYKPDFKFWGYIRRPGQPWSESQLVMLNEKQKLALIARNSTSAATTITSTNSMVNSAG